MTEDIHSKVANAAKWSTITEIASKITAPISGMIMARILTPEAYGAMAAISIVISFTELFTDAGFKTYIVQHEFKDETDRQQSINVAFWTNLSLSLLAWLIISLFRNPLASLVGSPNLGMGLAVACAAIPLTAFSSIQTAIFQREFDFKTLFYTRIASIIVPFVVNIPLALITRNYWALIVGNLVTISLTAIILTIRSSWKPSLFYSFEKLKEMLSFCLWLIVNSILVWATNYIDVFFISKSLDEHYLGLYRVSCNIVGQIMSIITAAILPVLFSAISRYQNDIDGMKNFLLKSQKYAAFFILPLGVGIWVFRRFITGIVLGEQWMEATNFIGIWGFMSAITIVFNSFCTQVAPAVGKPKLSLLGSSQHLLFLIPAVVISVQYGFEALYWTRSLIRIEIILFNLFMVYYVIRLQPWRMITNILKELIASIVMGILGTLLLLLSDGIIMNLLAFLLCCALYIAIMYGFKSERWIVIQAFVKVKSKLIMK